MLLIITSTGDRLFTFININDLEPSPKGFLVNFSKFLDAAHIWILNCDEMAGVRPTQPVYEICSIKCRFQQSKSRSPRFMEPDTGGHQRQLPLQKMVILPQLSGVTWKRLQINTDMLLIITSTGFYFTLYTNCPGGMTDAVARHVSFAQITCSLYYDYKSII